MFVAAYSHVRLKWSDLKGKGAWREMNMAHIFRVSPVEVCKRDTMERVSATNLTTSEFVERYEKNNKPVIITDTQADWPAREKWTLPVDIECFDCYSLFCI